MDDLKFYHYRPRVSIVYLKWIEIFKWLGLGQNS